MKFFARFSIATFLFKPCSIRTASPPIVSIQSGAAKRSFLSQNTLAEIGDVVLRPNILSRLPNTDVEKIEAFIEDVLSLSTLIRSVPKSFKLIRDPKDEIIIDLAIEAEAEYIVSRDKDLLDLMTGFTDDCKEFRQRFRYLKIVEPLEFLRIVKEKELFLKP